MIILSCDHPCTSSLALSFLSPHFPPTSTSHNVRTGPGFWVGKGFCSEGDRGRSKGYNLFMVQGEGQDESVGMGRNTEGRLVRKYHMTTQAQAPSFWDKNPSLELDYRGMQHFLGRMGMRDEVREVAPGLYLGLGSFGARESR